MEGQTTKCSPRTLRLLVVDDDLLHRRSLVRFLSKVASFEVEDFAKGADALARFREALFHAAVLDIDMPFMNGLELAHHLRALSPTLPLVFITGQPSSSIAHQVHALTHQGLLPKPLDRHHLVRVLEALAA